MACRTNLKKEKRLRNRINAFRFKKGGFGKSRFRAGPDYSAMQKRADEDAAAATAAAPEEVVQDEDEGQSGLWETGL